MTGKNKTQKNTGVLWIENALSDLPVFFFCQNLAESKYHLSTQRREFRYPFAFISRQTSSKLQKGQRSSDPSMHPPPGRRRGYLILCGEDRDGGRIKGFHKLLHATDQRGAFLVACKVWDYQITCTKQHTCVHS